MNDTIPCKLWLGGTNGKGYGQVRHPLGGPTGRIYVHRLTWILERGPIPDGLTIDHLCRNTLCYEVCHMELVPLAENARRAASNHPTCINGHRYEEGSYWIAPNGRRRCRACHRARKARYERTLRA